MEYEIPFLMLNLQFFIMKNDANFLNRNLVFLFLCLFTMGFAYAQMEETDSQENSVLQSFKDTSLEMG